MLLVVGGNRLVVHQARMSKMARNNPKVSPEVAVAVELVDLARQMRRLVYGGDGVPEWGDEVFAD